MNGRALVRFASVSEGRCNATRARAISSDTLSSRDSIFSGRPWTERMKLSGWKEGEKENFESRMNPSLDNDIVLARNYCESWQVRTFVGFLTYVSRKIGIIRSDDILLWYHLYDGNIFYHNFLSILCLKNFNAVNYFENRSVSTKL